jgi:DNA-binding NarL/FixJ family response regulator
MKSKKKELRIIIADDHKVFRQGLRNLVESQSLATIVGEAGNGEECIELAKRLSPHIILMDIDMPKLDGMEATRIILEQNPEIRVIALSMHSDYDHYQQMVKFGAKGFIQKSTGIDEVISAIRAVAQGGSYFSNDIMKAIVANMELNDNNTYKPNLIVDISSREMEVLKLICDGLTNEEISKKLYISPTTVKGHRSNLLSKTGAKNTASLIMFAVKNKLVKV